MPLKCFCFFFSWSLAQTESGGERLLLISKGIRGRCRDLDAVQGKLSGRAQLEADCWIDHNMVEGLYPSCLSGTWWVPDTKSSCVFVKGMFRSAGNIFMNVEHGLSHISTLMTCRELKLLAVASRAAGKQPQTLKYLFFKDLIKVLHFNLSTLDNK